MDCRNCGKSFQENLNYRSNCGARVEKSASENNSSWLSNPATAVGWLGVFGLGSFIFFCFILLRQNSNHFGRRHNKNSIEESDYHAPKKIVRKQPVKSNRRTANRFRA